MVSVSGAGPAIVPRLYQACQRTADGRAWLAHLPARVDELMQRWSLRFDARSGGELATCSFVAFVRRSDGTPAVLKLGLPHMEAQHETDGLLVWQGGPVVRVLEFASSDAPALLLERCEPGTSLATRPEHEQDRVIAELLCRLWLTPRAPHPFRPLLDMVRDWTQSALERRERWPDAGFVRAGIDRFLELAQPRPDDVLLATDLHAGNVLAAEREPWLVIDPKPFVGDRAYDATQHLLNCVPRWRADPAGTVTSFSDRLEVSAERVTSWLIARLSSSARLGSCVMGLSAEQAQEIARRLENTGV